jgi:hypothetical protein
VELELTPEQPPPVADAVASLMRAVDPAQPATDPWWQAGIDEALEP